MILQPTLSEPSSCKDTFWKILDLAFQRLLEDRDADQTHGTYHVKIRLSGGSLKLMGNLSSIERRKENVFPASA
jgi:hypothetical protein